MIYIRVKREKEIKEMLCCCEGCYDKNVYFKNLVDLGESLNKDKQLNHLLTFLKALGNRERLTIINALKQKDRCVCELEAILDKSQPSISHHLRELEKANLIRGWKKGKFTYYTLLNDQIKNDLKIFNEKFK
ncbi:MAG: ArsR/SmtB family transcription factor [Promethearchaeota archaeon]